MFGECRTVVVPHAFNAGNAVMDRDTNFLLKFNRQVLTLVPTISTLICVYLLSNTVVQMGSRAAVLR